MEAQTTRPPPPYFAFKTLTNMIERMEEHGPPNRVDRTFLTGMSGAGQTQFIAGLKGLGLIAEEDGTVQPVLTEMVKKPDERPALIGQLLRERYPEAVSLGETPATTGELVEVFKGYGVQGDTARKAIAFYLQAAQYAGDVPVSPNFKTPTVKSGTGGNRRRGRPPKGDQGEGDDEASVTGIPAGLHPALAGLLGDLPKRGQTWTVTEKQNFKAAFNAILKIAAPVSDPEADDDAEEDGLDD
ncbi:MAG: DUF5343 domain-containing protein [Actinomycetota bacterium]|nr:DUF5343 domain-containing protein [Actinomycetota bacterium]